MQWNHRLNSLPSEWKAEKSTNSQPTRSMGWSGELLKTTRTGSLAWRTGNRSILRPGSSSGSKRIYSIPNTPRSSDAQGRWSTWWLKIRRLAITLRIEGPCRCLQSLLTSWRHTWTLASLKDSKRSRVSSSEGSLILSFQRASLELRFKGLLRIAWMISLIRKWYLESST